MFKRIIGIVLAALIMILRVEITFADESNEQATNIYRQYVECISNGDVAQTVSIVSDNFSENKESLVSQKDLIQSIYKVYPDFTVLNEIASRDLGNDAQINIEGTKLYINTSEISYFDKVLICKRECNYWNLIEFVGLVNEDGKQKISYISIVLYNVALESGRLIDVSETYGITNNITEKGYESVGALYRVLFQMQLNDILTSGYFHIDHETEMKEYLENTKPVELNKDDISTSYGEVQIFAAQIHIYTQETLSVEIYYMTDADRAEYSEQLNEISKAIDDKVPGIKAYFPRILYLGCNNETKSICFYAVVEYDDYDENMLFD